MAPKRPIRRPSEPPTKVPKPPVSEAQRRAAQQQAVLRAKQREAPADVSESGPGKSEIARRKLADKHTSEYYGQTDHEQNVASFANRAGYLSLRHAAQIERLRSMDVPEELVEWAQKMSDQHGTSVQVRHEELIDGAEDEALEYPSEVWILGLALTRYGEAPEHWPDAFTDEDVGRAERWLSGKDLPAWVTPAVPETDEG